MFRSVAARALLGVGILGAAGGTTALAASPSPATPAAHAAPRAHPADVSQGVIIARSDSQITVERAVRDKTSKKVTKNDTRFAITAATVVYKAGSKDPVGHDALKLGERVRVRFEDKAGDKSARRVVILPDARAGKVISKASDSFVIHTRAHGDVKVVVTDKARYRSGKEAGSFAALKVGDHATAVGEEDSAHNFDASAVRYHDPATKPAASPAKPTAP